MLFPHRSPKEVEKRLKVMFRCNAMKVSRNVVMDQPTNTSGTSTIHASNYYACLSFSWTAVAQRVNDERHA